MQVQLVNAISKTQERNPTKSLIL